MPQNDPQAGLEKMKALVDPWYNALQHPAQAQEDCSENT